MYHKILSGILTVQHKYFTTKGESQSGKGGKSPGGTNFKRTQNTIESVELKTKCHSCEDRGHRVCHGLQNTQTKSKSKISNNFMNDLFLKRTTPQRNPSSCPHPSPTPQIKDYISILSSSLNGSFWVHFSTRQTCQQRPSPSSVSLSSEGQAASSTHLSLQSGSQVWKHQSHPPFHQRKFRGPARPEIQVIPVLLKMAQRIKLHLLFETPETDVFKPSSRTKHLIHVSSVTNNHVLGSCFQTGVCIKAPGRKAHGDLSRSLILVTPRVAVAHLFQQNPH